jgi:hypothetical protein
MLERGTRISNGTLANRPPGGSVNSITTADPGLNTLGYAGAVTATLGTATGGAANAVAAAGLVAAEFKVDDLVLIEGTNANNGMQKVTQAPAAASGPYSTDWMLCSPGFKAETATGFKIRTA